MFRRGVCLGIAFAALAPVAAGAVTREAVLSRGERWVAAKVPYSQTAYANEAGERVASRTQGWRTDCSGFVSLCLGLVNADGTPRSLDTATLPSKLIRISKSELKPGDVILRPKNLLIDGKQVPYGHALIFVRWIDAAKTRYIGYHESSSAKGTVASEITYPFYGEAGFSPYRYQKIEDFRTRKSRRWLGPLGTLAPSAWGASPLVSAVSTLALPSIGATTFVAPAQ